MIVLVLLSIVSGFGTICLQDDAQNLCLGFFTSFMTALSIESIYEIYDRSRYGFLAGKYERQGFFNKLEVRKNDSLYEEQTRYRTIQLKGELIYMGDRKYRGTAEYEEGQKYFEFTFEHDSIFTGKGRYQYGEKKNPDSVFKVDFGDFTFYVDVQDKRRIYVHHKNIIPSALAEGIEIWVKQ